MKSLAPFLSALAPPGVDLFVGGVGGHAAKRAQSRDVGNGFDIENENGPTHAADFSS